MANLCSRCPDKCCTDFKIGLELIDPVAFKAELAAHPYIHRTSLATILDRGRRRPAGIFNCDRFDRPTGLCQNYDTQPRPSFCQTTGTTGRPHSRCLLTPKSST